MTRAGTGSQASPGAVSAPASRADTCIRAAAGVTVAGLAGIAGAISYSHMQELAAAHGETGWQAHALPRWRPGRRQAWPRTSLRPAPGRSAG